MYAVFELSGFQFTVSEGDKLKVPHQKAARGKTLQLDRVLLVKDNERALIGTPTVADARIEAEVVGEGRDPKVLVYKFRRRTKYRRSQGHRQRYTELKIRKIVTPKA